MTTEEYSGSGDPRRSIELLWGTGPAPKRGPKPKFTVAGIVAVAVSLADGEGLPAVSMRRVAEQLGVTAMSLYTYVPSKAELLDVMVDTVSAEAVPAAFATSGWRDRLHEVARNNWELYRRHPWLLQVATTRPVLGPNVIAKYDFELRAFDGAGLSDVHTDMLLTLVLNYVAGAARAVVQADRAEARTGMTEEEWWSNYAPLLGEVLDPERWPTAARVGQAAGEEYGAGDPLRAYEFGLQRVLDGIAALL
ncbi:TetR/AcrR family transcriptional regulator [Dactylosporangium sp. AC04546]|uniref:TetR/AcrR family transcriptional regulator n=1 Tax=Dactylosporangium sp. AC04546 TaxID=2862460 RepID=UPI001EDF11F1|nr:TetR/AcrR family transcriptional regulator [Dactylosporangium sp. AC04546]WVK84640.1 TetR/AcrR family transcriptional regulator [Dactylosporangium sp. AC04546]